MPLFSSSRSRLRSTVRRHVAGPFSAALGSLRAAREAQELTMLSDDALARRGLSRHDIPRHVSRHFTD